jgi:intracellular septation protein A
VPTSTIQDEPRARTVERVALPTLHQIARRAVPQIVDGALLPLFLFLVVDHFAGLYLAMVAGLGWSAVAILRRVIGSRRVPAMVILGTAMLCVRSTLALSTGSAFLYFLHPTVGTAVVALAFLVSVPARRPLSGRFAGDFLTLPLDLLRTPHVQRFFMRNSMMWAAVGLFNAAAAYWLLVTLATSTFAITSTALSITVTVLAVGVSILWFRRSMSRYHLVTVGV